MRLRGKLRNLFSCFRVVNDAYDMASVVPVRERLGKFLCFSDPFREIDEKA